MKILNLKLENFRGVKSLDIEFNGSNVNVYGCNGTGKTTISNAICWLLTGSPMTGEKDFSPKTAGCHNLHHKAEMTIILDNGTHLKLAKDFYEKWTKKKGADIAELTGHTTDYFVDDVPSKEKDYKTVIDMACGGNAEQVKMLLISGYFAETIKAEERRKILFEICGDVSDGDIMQDERLKGFRKLLLMPGTENQYYSIYQYKAIATKQRTKYKDALKSIPARIDELTKNMPQPIDEETIRKEIADLEQKKAEVEASNKKEARIALIKGLKAEIEAKAVAYDKAFMEAHKEIQKEFEDLTESVAKLADESAKLFFKVGKDERHIQDLEHKRNDLLEAWNDAVKIGRWEARDGICPACGQELPQDIVESRKTELLERSAKEKARIREKGKECSDALIQELKAELELKKAKVDQIQKEILTKQARCKDIAAETEHDPFEETEEYAELTSKLEALQAKLDDDSANDTVVDDIRNRIEALNAELASADMARKMQERINELEDEQASAAGLLEEVEHGIFLCEEFSRIKAELVTDKINSRFSGISFMLFKDQINGGLKECCEPLIPNAAGQFVEFKSANMAAKVNAGLEIVKVLSKHYNMNLPIIIDQAESICELMQMEQQTIRLIVSASDAMLRIEPTN